MDDTLDDITEHLTEKAEWNADFRSSRTGWSFQDLKNEFEFIDGIGNMYDKIQKLEAEIDSFKSNVDTALCVSNSLTMIELE